jgi:hypothetical protein
MPSLSRSRSTSERLGRAQMLCPSDSLIGLAICPLFRSPLEEHQTSHGRPKSVENDPKRTSKLSQSVIAKFAGAMPDFTVGVTTDRSWTSI